MIELWDTPPLEGKEAAKETEKQQLVSEVGRKPKESCVLKAK
jgi:hypothetical protein